MLRNTDMAVVLPLPDGPMITPKQLALLFDGKITLLVLWQYLVETQVQCSMEYQDKIPSLVFLLNWSISW